MSNGLKRQRPRTLRLTGDGEYLLMIAASLRHKVPTHNRAATLYERPYVYPTNTCRYTQRAKAFYHGVEIIGASDEKV